MKIRKILAAVAATAVAVSAMAVNVFAAQDASALADGTAYLNLNKADWSDYEAEWTNAEVTGNGTYTVSAKMAEATDLGQFNALEIKNGETKFGTTYVVTVDSFKINGVEVKVGDSYTCSADGAGVTTRVNLYNEWNNPDESATNKDTGTPDNRAADGDIMSKTARLVGSVDDLAGIETIEVTFTVSGIGDAAASADAGEAADAGTPAGDGNTDSQKTGNVPAVAMVSVMALAGVAAVASKKRK